MKYKNKKGFFRGVKTASCMILCLALVMTLLTPELLTQETEAEAASVSASEAADYETDEASYASDEVIIVYYDEPLEEDAADAQSDESEAQDADASGDAASEDAEAADAAADEESVLDAAGVTEQEIISEDAADGTVVLAQLDGDVSVEEAIEVLEEDPAIDYVQPNYTYSLLTTEEDDTEVAEETIDSDASEELQYYLYSSSFTDAWESVTVDGAVTVAVIDTGCDMDHEDLVGTVDSAHAYDVTTGTLLTESSSDDAIGHGTYVCGIIAASASNGVGIAGASYNASVLPVKVFDADESCTTADLLAAYDYLDGLIEDGDVTNLKVINMSLGYYSDGTTASDQALEAAISAMRSDNGVLTICAGGNGTNGTANTAYCYPADFDACVSVTAVAADGENAAFSDYNDAKDIAAYGVNIYTTAAGGGYTTISGTSSAAPQVAAAAALLYAADASLTASEVVSILQDTADEITGNLHEETSDIGILNAQAAVESVLTEETAGTDEDTGSDVSDESAAEEEDDEDSSPEEGDHANSWRYSDGELISDPDTSDSDVDTLYDYYSTWNSSYGTTGFGITSYSDGSTLKATVSGAQRIVIDVSHHQGKIDWEAVAADGVDAAIIRCGYGSDDEDQDDRYWIYNITNAIANGIEVGVYLYSYADTVTKAKSEAAHVLRCLEEAGVDVDDLDLPIFYDMEDDLQTSMTEEELGEIAETFLGILEDEGYAVGIYASRSWWNSLLTDSVFENDDWYKWVARYPASTSLTSTGIDGTDLWQFTCNGTVDGISTDVDVSFDYLGEGAYTSTSASGSETTAPAQVTVTSAAATSDGTAVTVTWNQVSGAEGYRVYRKVSGGSWSRIAEITDGSTVSYTDTTVSSATTYIYTVRAYKTDSSGTMVLSATYNSQKTVTVPPVEVTLTSAKVSSDYKGITVTWNKVSGAEGYHIYRKVPGGTFVPLAAVTSGSTVTYTDNTVSYGTTYIYTVRAYVKNASGTKVLSPTWTSQLTATSAPEEVTLSSVTVSSDGGTVTVKWGAVDTADGYRVYRKLKGGTFARIATITSGSTVSYEDTGVSSAGNYVYTVRAYRVEDDGTTVLSPTYTSQKTVTVPPVEVTLTSAKVSSNYKGITVTWNKVSGAEGYHIYRKVPGGTFVPLAAVTSGSTVTYTDNTVSYGTTYIYTVRAYVKNTSGTKVLSPTWTSQLTATSAPAQVTLSSATASGTSVTVKWGKVSTADGYRVYRKKAGGSWSRIATISSGSTVSYTDTTASTGTTYIYTVRAYRTEDDGTIVLSPTYTSQKTVTIAPAQVTITSVTSTASKSGTVKWNAVSGASGYQVAYRISGTSTWYYTTVTTNQKVFTSLRNKNYYVKVRAYKTYSGTNYYGSWSSEKAMTVK